MTAAESPHDSDVTNHDDLLEHALHQFRTSYKERHRTLAGVEWRYFITGEGSDTLLMLPGAPGLAEMAFPYITAFAPMMRVIAPNYPPEISDAGVLLDGLVALLETESAGPAHIVGGSYSGLVAQYLIGRRPDLAHTLLLGDTGVPQAKRARLNRLLLALIDRMPTLALHAILFAVLRPILAGNSPRHRFWRRYLRAAVSDLRREVFCNRLRVWIDLDARACNEWPGLPVWAGPTLIVETEDDPLFSDAERRALKTRYPHATVHTFRDPGHTTALTRADDYVMLMRQFLEVISRA